MKLDFHLISILVHVPGSFLELSSLSSCHPLLCIPTNLFSVFQSFLLITKSALGRHVCCLSVQLLKIFDMITFLLVKINLLFNSLTSNTAEITSTKLADGNLISVVRKPSCLSNHSCVVSIVQMTKMMHRPKLISDLILLPSGAMKPTDDTVYFWLLVV